MDVMDLVLRLEALRRMQMRVQLGKEKAGQPIVDFADLGQGEVGLQPEERVEIKTKTLAVLQRLQEEASALLTLGGTIDQDWVDTHPQPTEALALLPQIEQMLFAQVTSAGLELLPDGNYQLIPSAKEWEDMLNLVATLGLGLKQYTGWLRPQIEAL